MFYEAFAGLGRISAGFAKRLAHAGMLTALTRLASTITDIEQSVEASEHESGAAAGDTSAQLEEAQWDGDCYAVFARAVPQVSHWVPSVGSVDCACMLGAHKAPGDWYANLAQWSRSAVLQGPLLQI